MNTVLKERVGELLDDIRRKEAELVELLQGSEEEFRYRLEGTKVRFERAVLEAHRKLRSALLPWLVRSELRNVLSAPFIYAMIVPISLLDLTMTLYQWVCFPLYGIERVARRRYLVVDRQQLDYAEYGDAEAYPIKVQELRAKARSRLAPTEE